MATEPDTARARAWNTHITEIEKLNRAQGDERAAIERRIAAHQDQLMTLPAPSLAAVAEKLRIL
jgi:hypothetical protein